MIWDDYTRQRYKDAGIVPTAIFVGVMCIYALMVALLVDDPAYDVTVWEAVVKTAIFLAGGAIVSIAVILGLYGMVLVFGYLRTDFQDDVRGWLDG